MSEPTWLTIARELQAIAQSGIAYTDNAFDRERYERVRELAASLMAEGSGANRERILELFRQDLGYATPKVDVRGAAFVGGRILMVREVSDGLWTLPGGWADVNQSAAECVVREFEEEFRFQCLGNQACGSLGLPQAGACLTAPCVHLQNVLPLPDHRRHGAAQQRDQRGLLLCARSTPASLAGARYRRTGRAHVRSGGAARLANGLRITTQVSAERLFLTH